MIDGPPGAAASVSLRRGGPEPACPLPEGSGLRCRRMWMGPGCAAFLALMLLMAGCEGAQRTAQTTLPDAAAVKVFGETVGEGYEALDKGNLDGALVKFRKLGGLVPDSPLGDYHIACAYGRSGMPEEAIQAMRRSVEKGFTGRVRAERDPDLECSRSHSAWTGLLVQMDSNLASQTELLHKPLPVADASSEPSFPDIDSLQSYYQQEFQDARSHGRLFPGPMTAEFCARITARQIAALERFRREHPGPSDLYSAEMGELRAVVALSDLYRPWILGRTEALGITRRIRKAYPDSSGAGEAALWEARAEVYGWSGTQEQIPAQEAERAVEQFLAVVQAFPGNRWACQALAEAIYFKSKATGKDIEQIRPLMEQLLLECGDNLRELEPGYLISEFALLLKGPHDFSATDLEGRTWSLASMRGTIVLLDFWATWCGPCIREIPALLELLREYAPEDLQILGVSLDDSERMPTERLREWLSEHEMVWPQIYEGAGWESSLAQLYGVPAIPFPVLIDRDGNVAAAGGGARAEALKEKLRELIER